MAPTPSFSGQTTNIEDFGILRMRTTGMRHGFEVPNEGEIQALQLRQSTSSDPRLLDCEQLRDQLRARAPARLAMINYLIDGLKEQREVQPIEEWLGDALAVVALVLDLELTPGSTAKNTLPTACDGAGSSRGVYPR